MPTTTKKITQIPSRYPEPAFDPEDAISRQSHPLYLNKYILPTDSINEMAQQVALWLRKGVTGGVITAKSDYGKTQAIKYIARIRRDLFGPRTAVVYVPMIKLPERKHAVWQYLAQCIGFAQITARPVDFKMLDKTVKGLIREADKCEANRMVIFLDDAQFMTKEDYAGLKPVYDALIGEYGKRVLVVSVGEPNLETIRSEMLNEGMTAVNRFLRSIALFEGLTDEDRIRRVLDAYDSVLCFPVGSEISFTESLCPNAFSSGFRLSTLTTRVDGTYKRLATRSAVGDGLVMTMKMLTSFVTSLLDTLADIDQENLEVTDNQIEQSLSDAIGLWSTKAS